MTAEEYLKTKVIKFESLSETLEFTVYSLTKIMEDYHESELKKLRVTDVSGSVCYCGKPSVEECEPCCSLACALKPKMYR